MGIKMPVSVRVRSAVPSLLLRIERQAFLFSSLVPNLINKLFLNLITKFFIVRKFRLISIHVIIESVAYKAIKINGT